MKRNQQGFTLIELMIVVAIIAILAAIAIPLYLNYTAQAEGTEALSLSAAAKTDVVAFYNETGHFPKSNVSAGAATATSINGKYVLSVTITSGVIAAKFRPSGVAKPLISQTISLSPYATSGSIVWICKAANGMWKDVPVTCRN
jgi:type IV pilus assembly protein PilA